MALDSVLSSWLALTAAALPVAQAVHAARAARGAADGLAAAWRAEHGLRACGALAAARRNLEVAAQILGGADALAAAREIADELEAAHPEAPLPDGAGVCEVVASLGLRAVLHEERNRDRPESWPNWIYRLEAAGP